MRLKRQLFSASKISFSSFWRRILDSLVLPDVHLLQATEDGQQALTMNIAKDGLNDLDASFVEQRHRAFGKCYTLYPAKWIREHGIYYYKIQL